MNAYDMTRWRRCGLAVVVAATLVAAACASSQGAETVSADETSDSVIDDGSGPIDINMAALTSGAWTLRFGGGPRGQIEPAEGHPITLIFDNQGSFAGSTGCNNYGGTYEVDGADMFYSEVFAEEQGCPGAIGAAEAAFLAAIEDVTATELLPDPEGGLVLSGPATELLFVPTSPEGDGDGEGEGESGAARPEIDATRITETWQVPADNEVQFLVSNQSLRHETVRITIEIDGEPVIDQDFEAGDQHNFFAFNVNRIEDGEHEITMRSDTGEELTRTFVKTDAPLWIVMLYWFDEFESQKFTFEVSDEPVEFA